MFKVIGEGVTYYKKIKDYELEINEKIVLVEKRWEDSYLDSSYSFEYQIKDIVSKITDRPEELTEEEKEELETFIYDLE